VVSRLDKKQRIGLVVAVVWTAVVLILAIALRSFVILTFIGLVAVILFPLRKQRPG